ncbi:hypothetical protein [Nevskia ramosa]|uniref:hypothetical protein n=1 Tax=Nevskia ramosa TaxID=64002 RepID=UPI002357DF17|nr:hypothetical protein [Nevskia ramosa]
MNDDRNDAKQGEILFDEAYGLDALTTPWKVVIAGCMGVGQQDVADFRDAHSCLVRETAVEAHNSRYVARWAAMLDKPVPQLRAILITGSDQALTELASTLLDDDLNPEERRMMGRMTQSLSLVSASEAQLPAIVHVWRTQQLNVKVKHAFKSLLVLFFG